MPAQKYQAIRGFRGSAVTLWRAPISAMARAGSTLALTFQKRMGKALIGKWNKSRTMFSIRSEQLLGTKRETCSLFVQKDQLEVQCSKIAAAQHISDASQMHKQK